MRSSTRTLNGNIVSKATYSAPHLWVKTAYFAEGNPSRPVAVVAPAEEGNGLYLTEYDPQTRGYQKGLLYACPAELGTQVNSYLNATVGEPCLYACFGGVDYCYYRKETDADTRKKRLAEIREGKVEAALPGSRKRNRRYPFRYGMSDQRPLRWILTRITSIGAR